MEKTRGVLSLRRRRSLKREPYCKTAGILKADRGQRGGSQNNLEKKWGRGKKTRARLGKEEREEIKKTTRRRGEKGKKSETNEERQGSSIAGLISQKGI